MDESYLQDSMHSRKKNVFTSTKSSFAPKLTDSYLTYEPEDKRYLISLLKSKSGDDTAKPIKKYTVKQLYEK